MTATVSTLAARRGVTGHDMQNDVRNGSARRLYGVLAGALLFCLSATGCASTQAAAKPVDRPPLVVPAPPERIIEPAPVDTTPEPVSDLPPPTSGAGTPTPPRRAPREAAPKPAATDSKASDAKPGEVKPVDPPPVDPSPVANPPAQLRTPQTSDTSGTAKNVRTTIDAAQGLLNSVNYQPLSNARKKAYNDAKLFMQQAEDALKQGNLVFAEAVAGKAEKLAKELAGR